MAGRAPSLGDHVYLTDDHVVAGPWTVVNTRVAPAEPHWQEQKALEKQEGKGDPVWLTLERPGRLRAQRRDAVPDADIPTPPKLHSDPLTPNSLEQLTAALESDGEAVLREVAAAEVEWQQQWRADFEEQCQEAGQEIPRFPDFDPYND